MDIKVHRTILRCGKITREKNAIRFLNIYYFVGRLLLSWKLVDCLISLKCLKVLQEKVGNHLTNMVVWQGYCPNGIPLATFPQQHHVLLKCLLAVGLGHIYPG